MVNKVKFKDLHGSYPIILRDELLSSATSKLEVFYKVNNHAIGSLLLQDPKRDCNLNFESPHVQSFITADRLLDV